MRNKQEIEKQAKGIQSVINAHKKQVDFYLQEDDFRKVAEYSQKIVGLQDELVLLEWVLDL